MYYDDKKRLLITGSRGKIIKVFFKINKVLGNT